MKIKKIKKENKKYKIIFENNEIITTYDDVIINNNLLYKKEINNEHLNKILEETKYYETYNKIIKYISTKLRSEYEIKKYMNKLEISEITQNEIIKKLKQIRLIDDYTFVKAYINDKINLSNDGPLKIKKDLINHKIDIDIIEKEIEKIDKQILMDKLECGIIKKLKSNTKYSNTMIKQKLIYNFINMGYDKNDILYLIEKNEIKEDERINKEYDKLYIKYSNKYDKEELKYIIKNKLYVKGYNYDEINEIMTKKDS